MKLHEKFMLLVVLGSTVLWQPVAAQSCDANCVKIKHFIAVMGATMEGCDKAFPDQKGWFTSAFKNWNLLKYNIPGLRDLLSERTPELQEARALVAKDFITSPKGEQEMQCSGYGNALANQDLFLPPAMLARYAHAP